MLLVTCGNFSEVLRIYTTYTFRIVMIGAFVATNRRVCFVYSKTKKRQFVRLKSQPTVKLPFNSSQRWLNSPVDHSTSRQVQPHKIVKRVE